MGGRGWVGTGVAVLLSAGCATTGGQALQPTVTALGPAHTEVVPASTSGVGGSGLAADASEAGARRYVDPLLGFEITRPSGNWQLDANDELSPEGLAVPLVMRQRDSGAQVVLQIAPGVASPTQFAERLTAGLRSHDGFSATDPEPLALADGAVGFEFEMGTEVAGRVAVVSGKRGEVFMVMATWPTQAPEEVGASVDQIIGSLKTLAAPPVRRAAPAVVQQPRPSAQAPAKRSGQNTEHPGAHSTVRAPEPRPMPLGPEFPQGA